MNKNQKSIFSAVLLSLTSIFWGLAFIFQRLGMDYVGPNTFNSLRFLLAGIFLSLVFIFLNNKNLKESLKSDKTKFSIKGGIIIGFILLFAGMSQQIGLLYTSVGKAGFISVLYIIIVPLINIFFGQKIDKKIIFCVFLSLIGLYFLTMKDSFNIEKGDILILISAFLYSLHIIEVGKYAKKGDSLIITIFQFLVAGCISFILGIIFENPSIKNIILAYRAILYTGLVSCGLGYTLQVVGQKNLNSTLASLIMSLESVFAAFGAYLILKQIMSMREIIGSVILLVAVCLAQIPKIELKKRKS